MHSCDLGAATARPIRLPQLRPPSLPPAAPPQVMTSKDETGAGPSRTEQAKQLLAQYGSAYLITSISFAIVSFAACYAAVSAGEGPGTSIKI